MLITKKQELKLTETEEILIKKEYELDIKNKNLNKIAHKIKNFYSIIPDEKLQEGIDLIINENDLNSFKKAVEKPWYIMSILTKDIIKNINNNKVFHDFYKIHFKKFKKEMLNDIPLKIEKRIFKKMSKEEKMSLAKEYLIKADRFDGFFSVKVMPTKQINLCLYLLDKEMEKKYGKSRNEANKEK